MRVAIVVVAAWLAVTGARPHGAAPGEPGVVVLSGVLTRADKGTYQEHLFEVPDGIGRLDFEFAHSHQRDGTQLEVGVFDTATFPIAGSPASLAPDLPVTPGDWVHIRLRDASGITAISNPVYAR